MSSFERRPKPQKILPQSQRQVSGYDAALFASGGSPEVLRLELVRMAGSLTPEAMFSLYLKTLTTFGEEVALDVFGPWLEGGDDRALASLIDEIERDYSRRSDAAHARSDVAKEVQTEDKAQEMAGRLSLDPEQVSIRFDKALVPKGAPGAVVEGEVVLDPSQVDPSTRAGREVIAHELVHLKQLEAPVGAVQAAEAEAARIGALVAQGHQAPTPVAGLAHGAVAYYGVCLGEDDPEAKIRQVFLEAGIDVNTASMLSSFAPSERVGPHVEGFEPTFEAPGKSAGEHVPPGVHLITGQGQAYALDWSARNGAVTPSNVAGMGKKPTLKEAFGKHEARQIKSAFGEGITTDDVYSAIDVARQRSRMDVVEKVRAKLFQAQQYAAIETLNVEQSARYQRTSTSTCCNIYAYDLVTALGGYLPRVWWTEEAIKEIEAGTPVVSAEEYAKAQPVTKKDQSVTSEDQSVTSKVLRTLNGQKVIGPEYGVTVTEQSANDLTAWMNKWGKPKFGWEQLANAEAAQEEANKGNIVVILAANKRSGHSGHVSVVIAESGDHKAKRDDKGKVEVPLQSQAGAKNFKYGTGGTWWSDKNHKDGGFWVYRGASRSPIAIPTAKSFQ